MIQPPNSAIETVDQLKEYLQIAIQLEHATLPPYLTAAYSAHSEANHDAIGIICAVAREEMLHLAQAANLLNAVGGEPNLLDPKFVPHYPAHLPTGQDDFDVGIERLSDDLLQLFLDIERPSSVQPKQAKYLVPIEKTVEISGDHLDSSTLQSPSPFVPITKIGANRYALHYEIGLIPEHLLTPKRKAISHAKKSLVPHVRTKDSDEEPIVLHYWSIGDFYRAIHLGFVELSQLQGEDKLFCGDSKRQIDAKYFYSAGGEIITVRELKSALSAIDFIAGQGEGSNNRVYDDQGELAHYYRFDQILQRRYYRLPGPNGENGDAAGLPRGGAFPVDMSAVFPIKANAKISDYHVHPELLQRALQFNGRYKRFLTLLQTALNGEPGLLGPPFASEMFQLKRAMLALIHNPIPGTGFNAAPTFEMDKVEDPVTGHVAPERVAMAVAHG